ncbi:MAG: GAF domain-containing protein [Anaerolineales bacterium]|nr:GAF domain-containing protein [Anaerolineales bacterium]
MSNLLEGETHQALIAISARNEAYQRVARALVETEDVHTALHHLVDIAAEALNAYQTTLITFDLIKRRVEVVARGGPGAKDAAPAADVFQDASNFWMMESWRQPNAANTDKGRTFPGTGNEPIPWTTITAPMIYCERILGILKASNPPDHPPFTQADEETLATLANQAALAVEGNRLRRSENLQRRQAETLREVARILNYSLDQQRVLVLILDQLARVVDYDSASIMLLTGSSSDQRLAIAAHRKLRTPEQLSITGSPEEFPHIAEVLERRRPVIIEDTALDTRWRLLPHSNYIRCWLGVPLVGRDQVIGLLNLDKEQPGYYTQQDAELAAAFANQAAIAIENARLYTSERQRGDQLDALRATIADISSELELPRLLQSILQRAVNLLNATGGDLGLFDENKGEIKIVVSYNMGKDYAGTRMAIGEGAMGMAVKTRRPIIVDDYQQWENASPQYKDGLWRAVLATPLVIGRRIVGAMGITVQDPQRKFTPADQYLISLFAQHAAIAVDNARLYLAAREAAERRSILHQVSQEILSASLEPEEIYSAIHKAASRLMTAEAFAIARLNVQENECEAVYLYDGEIRLPARRQPANQGLSGKVLAGSKSVYIPDLVEKDQDDGLINFKKQQHVRSVLAAPMRLRGQVIGMISAQSYQPGSYTEEDQALLEMLAAYAAIALDNASLFQNIQQLAITDSLTGLFNRRHLFELGNREFLRARRFSRPLSALMLDIDHFKRINDRYGHAVGDNVLLRLAQIIRNITREIDIAGRYGGEEFILVLPETDIAGATEIANRLLDQIRLSFQTGSLPSITVSIGVAALQTATVDFNYLVHTADLAMYAAKNAGRNRIATYNS